MASTSCLSLLVGQYCLSGPHYCKFMSLTAFYGWVWPILRTSLPILKKGVIKCVSYVFAQLFMLEVSGEAVKFLTAWLL